MTARSFFPSLTFKIKLLLLIFLTIAVLLLFCIWLAVRLQMQLSQSAQQVAIEEVSATLRQEWIQDTLALSNTISDLLIQPLYSLNVFEVNRIASSIQQQEPIHYVVILDKEDRVVGTGDMEYLPIGAKLTQFEGKTSHQEYIWREKDVVKVLETITPIRLGNNQLGTVVIGFPIKGIEDDTYEIIKDFKILFRQSHALFVQNLILYGSLILLFAVVVAIIIARKTVQPILRLVGEVRKIAEGSYNLDLDLSRNDEIGMLNTSFMTMSQELEKREKSRNLAKVDLEKRVELRTSELNEINERLLQEIEDHKQSETARLALEDRLKHAEKMEALGTLAGGVAHDLNNILTGLVGYPELVLFQLEKDNELRPLIETIKASGEKASAVVEDLLTLARRGVSTRRACNVNMIISDLERSLEWSSITSAFPNVCIVSDLDEKLWNVRGSDIHLSKTIMNLVRNGAEAILDEGEVSIRTRNEYVNNPFVQHEEMQEGKYVVVTVSDNGKGIGTDEITKIFEPFYTTKQMGRSGTGLGMAVVWGTIKDHGGYIDVQSSVGEGTQFQIYLPATEEEVEVTVDSLTLDDLHGRGKILVVDDDETQRTIAMNILTRLGYTVTLADGGEQALKLLSVSKFDLIILDMIMHGGMDGLQTYEEIREIDHEQKVIIASGFSESWRIKKAQQAGAGTYVKKPYQLVDLAQAVKKAM